MNDNDVDRWMRRIGCVMTVVGVFAIIGVMWMILILLST